MLVDGVDVRDHQLHHLRSQIAMVAQDTVLLDGTLRENIVCGRPGVGDRDVARAARLALVDEFAARLPDGLDTRLGERGADLSGGQRQRVSIARAILRDAPIVILDEPTSALDAASEELLLEALDNLPRRPHPHRDRPPAVDDPRRRPDPRARARPDQRAGTHDELCAQRWALRPPGRDPVRPAGRRVSRVSAAPAGVLVPTAPPGHGR